MQLHLKIEVTGTVQVVWFRKSTKEKADELGLFGFVENCDNGSVYIEVEGDQDTLESFIQWCHNGPDLAQVKDVVVLQYQELKHFGSFEIRRMEWFWLLTYFAIATVVKIAELQSLPTSYFLLPTHWILRFKLLIIELDSWSWILNLTLDSWLLILTMNIDRIWPILILILISIPPTHHSTTY